MCVVDWLYMADNQRCMGKQEGAQGLTGRRLTAVRMVQMRALAEMENSGLVPLLQQDRYEDLARMYALFKRVEGGLDLMRAMMGDHLKDNGRALVTDPERTKDPVDFVHKLLQEKDKYDRCACSGAAAVPAPSLPSLQAHLPAASDQ
jgi:hypothetical protein